VGDPVQAGFVKSLARPGGNITGVNAIAVELVGKQLELLKEAVPGVTRIAVLGPRGVLARHRPELQRAAQALGVHVQSLEVSPSAAHGLPAEIERALEAATWEG
jgi:putative tryptophan/tyrosine transport system substrate-binding protein